ncbi:MAG: hypothetical protein QF371_07105, partial [Flavobacteriales bacterium]|nr:hypothetical protein [Flavobacteriales bacterium]
IKTGDGITIDLTAPTVGTVNDGAGEDIAEINSTTTLSANGVIFNPIFRNIYCLLIFEFVGSPLSYSVPAHISGHFYRNTVIRK